MDQQVDLHTAYLIAHQFLQHLWERGGRTSDDLASLTGSMSLLPEGGSADPAMIEDWLTTARAVLRAQSQPGVYSGADLELDGTSHNSGE